MPNAVMLLGNHEYMMLDALTKASPENKYIQRWYRNGGNITHARLLHCSKAYRQEMLEIIRTLSVTSSPMTPSPLVSARNSLPFL